MRLPLIADSLVRDVRRLPRGAGARVAGVLLILASAYLSPSPASAASAASAQGQLPRASPTTLRWPPHRPLSVMARLGERLFQDRRLSGSQRLACTSCHDPAHAYGPPGDASVVLGGPALQDAGYRAVPSLGYLYRQPAFSIGPDVENGSETTPTLQQQARAAAGRTRAQKSAQAPQASATALVPQGGLFWDGRVDTLQAQAQGPLFNPAEMDAGSAAVVLAKLERWYAADFRRLFGPYVFRNPQLTLDEAMFAIARYQIESPAFHPFTSKFDAWLAGRARFTPAEARGYRLFNDPSAGNCAACHVDQPSSDGLPPLFTDFQYEALGVPRNAAIPANRNPRYYDLGLCGPYRRDLRSQTQYCGLFLTPSLRNVATRRVFFHNGVFHSLQQVLDWYVNRDLQPGRFYPHDSSGRVILYDDLPAALRSNVDHSDAPFNRHPGDPPALNAAQIRDVIAFLHTLTDGYASAAAARPAP